MATTLDDRLKCAWRDVSVLRAFIALHEPDLERVFDPEDARHTRTLLDLRPDELARLLEQRQRPAYMGGPLVRALSKLSCDWMRRPERAADARSLFDVLIEIDLPNKEIYSNALWSIQQSNTSLQVAPDQARRYVELCEKHGVRNPAIFYQAACVLAELGDKEGTLERLRSALRHGYQDRASIAHELGTAPRFGFVKHDPRFLLALEDRGPQGRDLIRLVIGEIRTEGWRAVGLVPSASDSDGWPKHAYDFRPLEPSTLETLMLPNGECVPPSLREWLAFDAGWLHHLGWFKTDPSFAWTPRSLDELARDEYGTGERVAFDAPLFRETFLLPCGTVSRRVYVLTSAADSLGEYPVMWTDIDGPPAIGVMFPGLDVWLANQAGLVTITGQTYASAFDDFRFQARCAQHARIAFDGDLEREFPTQSGLTAPMKGELGPVVCLNDEDWFASFERLRAQLPNQKQKGLRLFGANQAALERLARTVRGRLPASFTRFYERINGLDWEDLRFFSIEEILNEGLQCQLRKAMNAAAHRAEVTDNHWFFLASRKRDIGGVLGAWDGEGFSAEVQYGVVSLCSAARLIEQALNATTMPDWQANPDRGRSPQSG